jgi:hypothetical protein
MTLKGLEITFSQSVIGIEFMGLVAPSQEAECFKCIIVMETLVYCSSPSTISIINGQRFSLIAQNITVWNTTIGFPHSIGALKALPSEFVVFERTEITFDFGLEVISAPKFLVIGQLLIPVIPDASSTRFHCVALFTSVGSFNVEVSFDGIKSFRSSLIVSIRASKTISFLSPTLGPIRGGTTVFVSSIEQPALSCSFGAGNTTVPAILDLHTSQYTCVTPMSANLGQVLVTVKFLSSQEDAVAMFMYHEDLFIISVHPVAASSGQTITVEGSGFQTSRSLFCHFGSQTYMGNVISPFHCTCIVPSGIEGNHSISVSFNAALEVGAISLHTVQVVDYSFSILHIQPSISFVNREQLFTIIGSRFSANLSVSSACMQSGVTAVVSATVFTVYLKPQKSGICHAFMFNMKCIVQTSVLVLDSFIITEVIPNVLFPGRQYLSIRLSELIASDLSLHICCTFAEVLSPAIQIHNSLSCALDVLHPNVSSSFVSIQLVDCNTLESLSNSVEIVIQKAPVVINISPRTAFFGFSTLTVSGIHFNSQIHCTFNFASSVAEMLDSQTCLCPVPLHLEQYAGDILVSVLFQSNIIFTATIHVLAKVFTADSEIFKLWRVEPSFILINQWKNLTVQGSNFSGSSLMHTGSRHIFWMRIMQNAEFLFQKKEISNSGS